MVATAVIFSSALPAMFGTFVKHRFQNTYDAILAAPVDVEELVTAEMLWIALRSGIYGCVPLIVTFFWGLDPSWGMLLVPGPVAFVLLAALLLGLGLLDQDLLRRGLAPAWFGRLRLMLSLGAGLSLLTAAFG